MEQLAARPLAETSRRKYLPANSSPNKPPDQTVGPTKKTKHKLSARAEIIHHKNQQAEQHQSNNNKKQTTENTQVETCAAQ
jgi:hypothetical protein